MEFPIHQSLVKRPLLWGVGLGVVMIEFAMAVLMIGGFGMRPSTIVAFAVVVGPTHLLVAGILMWDSDGLVILKDALLLRERYPGSASLVPHSEYRPLWRGRTRF